MPRVKPKQDSSAVPKKNWHKARAGGLLSKQSKYRDSWLETIAQLGQQGKTRTQIASALRINATTIRNLEKRVPAFRDAMEQARLDFEAYMTRKAVTAMNDRTFQTALFQIVMRNCCGWSSGDRVEHNVTGKVKHEGELKVTVSKEEVAVG